MKLFATIRPLKKDWSMVVSAIVCGVLLYALVFITIWLYTFGSAQGYLRDGNRASGSVTKIETRKQGFSEQLVVHVVVYSENDLDSGNSTNPTPTPQSNSFCLPSDISCVPSIQAQIIEGSSSVQQVGRSFKTIVIDKFLDNSSEDEYTINQEIELVCKVNNTEDCIILDTVKNFSFDN